VSFYALEVNGKAQTRKGKPFAVVIEWTQETRDKRAAKLRLESSYYVDVLEECARIRAEEPEQVEVLEDLRARRDDAEQAKLAATRWRDATQARIAAQAKARGDTSWYVGTSPREVRASRARDRAEARFWARTGETKKHPLQGEDRARQVVARWEPDIAAAESHPIGPESRRIWSWHSGSGLARKEARRATNLYPGSLVEVVRAGPVK